jgi:hypothetical protein
MTRSLVLFVHVAGVLVLFAGLGVEWLSLDAVRRSVVRAEAVRWVRVNMATLRISGMALALILASGLFLANRIAVMGDGWIRASFAGLLLLGVAGGGVTQRRMRALQRAAAKPGDEGLVAIRAGASASILDASLHVRVTLGTALVYLMIAKPAAGESAIVLIVALVLAVVLAVAKRPARSALVQEYR